MFSPQFDDARRMLKYVQDQTDPAVELLNSANPNLGGRGLTSDEVHRVIGTLVANVENLSQAVGKVIDYLDEHHEGAQ